MTMEDRFWERAVHIIRVNTTASAIAFYAPVFWVFSLFMYLVVGSIELFHFIFFSLLVVAALFVLIWRVFSIMNVLRNGREVTGTVLTVDINSRRAREMIRYEYEYNGKKFRSSNWVREGSRNVSLNPGDRAAVLVNPILPRSSVIKDLYVES